MMSLELIFLGDFIEQQNNNMRQNSTSCAEGSFTRFDVWLRFVISENVMLPAI